MGKAGRPFGTLKYDNLEDLQNGIDKYFDDCEKNNIPCTVEGLAYSLHIDERTLLNYEKIDNYFPSIARAKLGVRKDVAERGFTKEGAQFAKYYASNNFGRTGGLDYAERQELSVDAAPITFKDFPD